MLERFKAVSYELLRPEQVLEIRNACPIVYIPAGSLEWHSFQNPLGTDGLKAHAICCQAALDFGGVVLPPIYNGLVGDDNWGPKGWNEFTLGYNQRAMQDAAFAGNVRALVQAGWRVIVGVTGHDVPEQREALQQAIERGTAGTAATGFGIFEGELHTPDDDLPWQMDHAGAWETSCMMYACPETVSLDDLRKHRTTPGEQLNMADAEGIGGKDPIKYASAELGEKIVRRMGKLIGSKAKQLLDERR